MDTMSKAKLIAIASVLLGIVATVAQTTGVINVCGPVQTAPPLHPLSPSKVTLALRSNPFGAILPQ